ncbi:AraC family transcriptional regulator [Flavobacterium sp. XS2P39]|uniref:AraC family transcriptional regulator n=1 Tax=Flavobacterium sp. XS2P39 TaxID=3401725 RepID=UPI003AAD8E0D
MSKKKIVESILKYEAIVNDGILEKKSVTDGFSITLNLLMVDYEAFKNYFRSDYFHLIFIESGEATININLTDYHVKKNDFLLSSPFDIKRLIKFKDCKISTILFTGDFLEKTDLLKSTNDVLTYFTSKYSPKWSLNQNDSAIVKKNMKELDEKQGNILPHPYGKELLYLAFTSFLYEIAALAQKYAQSINKNISRKENLVINFTALIVAHFKKERSLQFYASELNITAKYLTETIKEITGKTAGEIVESFVIQEAKMLLNNPELSIAEIAEELNFSDQSFFGKFFKRCTGFSPKSYRLL